MLPTGIRAAGDLRVGAGVLAEQCRVQGSGARRQPVEKSPQRRDSLRDDGLLHVDRRVAQLAASHVVEGLRAGAAR
jgi:hypothetical protein